MRSESLELYVLSMFINLGTCVASMEIALLIAETFGAWP